MDLEVPFNAGLATKFMACLLKSFSETNVARILLAMSYQLK
jgi:hypothetical protein